MVTRDPSAWSDESVATLLELVDEPMLVVDGELRVRVWNAAAERDLKFRRLDMIGAPCLAGVRSPECMGQCPILQGDTDSIATVYRKDGSQGTFRRTGRVLRSPVGDVIGVVERLIPVAAVPDRRSDVRFHGITSRAPAMLKTIEAVRCLASAPIHTVVVGETGTGKGIVALAIHLEGGEHRPLVRVSCDTELRRDWPALFERAQGGTLLLEHLQDLPAQEQRALARAWPEDVRTRLIATVRPDLEELLADGVFDTGLFYRLRSASVRVPPLRERLEDLAPLANRFLEEWAAKGQRPVRGFSDDALAALRTYHWPGNVRELSGVVAHAYVLGTGPEITAADLPEAVSVRPAQAPTRDPDQDLKERVRWAIAHAGGRVGGAADLLGMSRSSFWRTRRRLGV